MSKRHVEVKCSKCGCRHIEEELNPESVVMDIEDMEIDCIVDGDPYIYATYGRSNILGDTQVLELRCANCYRHVADDCSELAKLVHASIKAGNDVYVY